MDKIWGMLWRFGLVIIITWFCAWVVVSLLERANAHPMIQSAACTSVWLVPMFLANRARSMSSEE